MLLCAFLLMLLIFLMSLIFTSCSNIYFSVFLLWFNPYETLCTSQTWVTIFFSMFRKFLTAMFSNIFSDTLSFYSPSGTPKIWMSMHFTLLQRPLRWSTFFSPILFLYSPLLQLFQHLYLPSHFFFCFIHSAIDYFLGLPLLLLLQVIFQVVCLLSLYIFGFVRFNFATVSVTDCHLIFSNLLCLWFSFCRLHIYSFLWFWCLPSMEWGWSWGLCRLPGLRNWFLPSGHWS